MSRIVDRQIRAALDLLEQDGADRVVIATYSREEFAELRPGENYDEYKRQERAIAEGLAARGLLGRIVFQPITAAGYYRWLAAHPEIEPGEAARSAYAASIAESPVTGESAG